MSVGGTRSEWLTIGLVALGLVAAETAMRLAKSSLSLDVAHLSRVDDEVRSLVESDGLRILLAGNSLLRAGVDPAALEAGLERRIGREVSVGLVYPDGSNPLEWQYLHRRLLHRPGRRPDVVVIAFGPGHLGDRQVETQRLLRLAAHHVHVRDVPLVMGETLLDLEQRSQFVLARASNAFAFRDRIAPRVLDMVIPGYRERAPILYRSGPPDEAPGTGGAEPVRTYENLRRLVTDYEGSGVKLLALPMPAPEPYEVAEGALRLFAEAGVTVVGTYGQVDLVEERFPDREHLDAEGQATFTTALVGTLAAELREVGVR